MAPPSTSAAVDEEDEDVLLPVSPIATMITSRSSKLLWALWGEAQATGHDPSPTIERTRSDVDDTSIPTRWSVRGVGLILGSLFLPVLAFTLAHLAFFLLELLWCQWLHVGDVGTANGCELCVWLLTPAIGLALCAIGLPIVYRYQPLVRQRLKLTRGSLPLLCWCTCIVGMLVVAPVGRVWYRFYDTASMAPAQVNVTDMPAAALAGARQYELSKAVVASALVSEHSIVKTTARSYYCVAPLVADEEEALRLFDYAHALMPVSPDEKNVALPDGTVDPSGLGAASSDDAAALSQQEAAPSAAAAARAAALGLVNVSAWVAYEGDVPCLEPIHEVCTTNALAAKHCKPAVPIPDLTRAFSETRVYQSWSSDETVAGGVSVRRAGAMVDRAAMFALAVQNSALPSLDGAPVIWWGVDLEGYTQCSLDNALSMLGFWWIGVVVVAACTLYLPQLAGLLATGFVVLAWVGAEFVYDDERCLIRFLPQAASVDAGASVSAVS